MSHEPEGAIAQAPESRASVPSPADAGLCSLFVTLSVRPLGGPALPLSSFTLQRGPRERGRPHSQDSLPQAVCAVLTATGAAPSAGGWLCGAGREAPSARPEPPGVSVLHLHLRAGSAEVQGRFITQKAATVTKRALGVAEASGAACAAPGLAGSGPLTTCWAARSLGGGTRRGLRNSPSAPRLFHVLKLMDFNSFYKDGMRFDSRVTRGPRRARRVCRLLRCAAARPGEGGLAPRVTPLPDGNQLSRSLFW